MREYMVCQARDGIGLRVFLIFVVEAAFEQHISGLQWRRPAIACHVSKQAQHSKIRPNRCHMEDIVIGPK